MLDLAPLALLITQAGLSMDQPQIYAIPPTSSWMGQTRPGIAIINSSK